MQGSDGGRVLGRPQPEKVIVAIFFKYVCIGAKPALPVAENEDIVSGFAEPSGFFLNAAFGFRMVCRYEG